MNINIIIIVNYQLLRHYVYIYTITCHFFFILIIIITLLKDPSLVTCTL